MEKVKIDFYKDLLEELAWEDVAERPDYLEQLLADYEYEILKLSPAALGPLRIAAYNNPAMRDEELIAGLVNFPAARFLFPELFKNKETK